MKSLAQRNCIHGQDSEELEALNVQCPPDARHQDLHVYASKTVAVDGFLISVQCEPVKVVSTNENLPTTGTSHNPMINYVALPNVFQIEIGP